MFDADANATKAVSEPAWQAYCAALRRFPHGLQPGDRRAGERAIAKARATIAGALDAEPAEVVFTAGGSQANALALWAGTRTAKGRRAQLVLSALEHRTTHAAAEDLAAAGQASLAVARATAAGRIDVADAERLCAGQAGLLSCLLAHNESGVIQPIAQLAERKGGPGMLLHADAVQAVGRIPLSFRQLPVDLLSLAGHKLGALGGAGALLVKRSSPAFELLGCASEHGAKRPLPPGGACQSVALVASLAAAFGRFDALLAAERDLAPERDGLAYDLAGALGGLGVGMRVLGAGERRLPNTLLLHLAGVPAETLLIALDLAGFAVSSGAACSAGAAKPSASLLAMGLSPAESRCVIRISLRPGSAEAPLGPARRALVAAIVQTVRRLG